MTVKQLIEVLEGMDPDRVVYSSVLPGTKIHGVGTEFIDKEPVTVIR